MTARTLCNCDRATTGRCFLKHDRILHELNSRLIEKPTRLGWYAFAQEEAIRLHEKGDWMQRLGIGDIADVVCESDATCLIHAGEVWRPC